MQNIFKVAIVGGGTSGLVACVELVNSHLFSIDDICILEKNDRVGKKLLATGNGQGNVTNISLNEENYYGENDFIKIFLEQEKTIDLKKYLYNLGIPLYTDEKGRVYPLSRQANSILDTFRNIIKNKATVFLNQKVKNIEEKNDIFIIYTNDKKIYAKNVVLACGGKSAKQFGTDGSSYILAENFGHKLTDLFPSLVQLKTEKERIKGLAGLKESAKIFAYNNDKLLKQAEGDILFTNYGVSGNAIFSVSSAIVDCKNSVIKIEFLPWLKENEVEKIISDKIKNSNCLSQDILSGILNKRVGQNVYKFALDKSPKGLAKEIKNYQIKVTGNMGFDNSQVTKGGIKTKDIDAKSYQSKLKKGLFILGEMLDIDGDCGGYNLTFALNSGIICAKKIIENKGE